MEKINKFFPGVHALKDVDFTLAKGEVHGLIGENGAGKSTLMNVLGGEFASYSGNIFINGKEIKMSSQGIAKDSGVSFIHQELSLFQHMDVASNMFIEKFPGSLLFLDKKQMNDKCYEILKVLKLEKYKPTQRLSDLQIGEQQLVEIGRALIHDTKILVLDEPTSSLTDSEIKILFDIIKALKQKGVSIILITHRLDEIFEVCDNITIMRDGAKILTTRLQDIERAEIVRQMIGREVDEFYRHEEHHPGDELLRVENLCQKNKLMNISFRLNIGEVLGIYGLLGSGRTEILRSLFGLDAYTSCDIYIRGEKVNIKTPEAAIKNGIALVSEDRRQEGLVLSETVKYNLSLSSLETILKNGFISGKKEALLAEKSIRDLGIKTPSANNQAALLSGGNQQKVVIAKWLNTNPTILLMDEPTKGIDIGAKSEIYKIMEMLLLQGVGIVLISSELPELIGICDKVLVIKEGVPVALLKGENITGNKMLNAAMGAEL